MFAWEKHIKVWQLVGAVLAVPAGVAGTYSVYHNYMSGGVSCSELRQSIIAILDKNLTADVKRTLLRSDVEKFEKNCAAEDPDAEVIFHAAVAPTPQGRSVPSAPAQPVSQLAAIFGLSHSGERRGWVSLMRHSQDGTTTPGFDGAPIAPKSLPPVGSVLTARALTPVWLDPPPPGRANDSSELQGRIAAGTCVKVLTQGPPGRPFWAEVAPEACKTSD